MLVGLALRRAVALVALARVRRRRARCRGAPFELAARGLWSSAFAATELVAVHIESRGEAHALNVLEIPTSPACSSRRPATLVARPRAQRCSSCSAWFVGSRCHKLALQPRAVRLEAAVACSMFCTLIGGPTVAGEPSAGRRSSRCSSQLRCLDTRRHARDHGLQRLARTQMVAPGASRSARSSCVANTAIGIVARRIRLGASPTRAPRRWRRSLVAVRPVPRVHRA